MKELQTLTALIDSFAKLPGVGVKTAERMAYAVLEMDPEDAMQFAEAIQNAKSLVHHCPNCGLYAEKDVCDICADPTRDHSTCVVISYPKDALAFERINGFHGVYHVLGGVISPTKGYGAADLDIDHLLQRIKDEGIKEIILATNPTLEGETTALFLAKLLEGEPVSVTRLGYGLPMGASLDYADSLTLEKALEGRRKL
ncbi:MAG: recombination protein RecR [Bacilli bacterium]|nr:recombination protein RecR [Bacilli bacterium]